MDEHGKRLQGRLQFVETNIKALEELVAKMLRLREEQESFHYTFAKTLSDVSATEDAKPLAQCLFKLSESSTKMAKDTHDVMLQRPEPEILQVLTQIQDWGVVPLKRLLDDREKALKIEQKLQKEYDDRSRSATTKEKEKKWRMLSDQKRRVENVNALIDHHMKMFEDYRLAKMKQEQA
ncbi:hypothetical protein P43SY_000445 [Pythium insidiosum]|uniref:Uncharacterized protein n=1 Tax=Pythium insidiosum TaxID=114742 RepID=A0AAD5QBC6_PYTIN|nr:hypothetical protein P43SY_000445 [Pythium insidiosum]